MSLVRAEYWEVDLRQLSHLPNRVMAKSSHGSDRAREPSQAEPVLSQSPPPRLFSCNSRTKVHAFSTAMLDLVSFSLDFFSTPFRFAVPLSLCLDLLHGCTIAAQIHCTAAHLV